jgi:NADP-dependent 3-hydroxy acid dehydrogenase YdfG
MTVNSTVDSAAGPAAAGIRAAVITGASTGFGRAIAEALVAAGTDVVGIARDEQRLQAVRAQLGPRFIPIGGDATDENLAASVLRAHRPGILVLNAGGAPRLAPLQEQTWESFSINWQSDTRQAFVWTKAALLAPLAPGGVVLEMSSGAALGSSPLSGGYAGAKAAIRFIRNYAAEEAERAGLGIRFVSLFPQLAPSGLGNPAVDAYAARAGVDRETFLERLGPTLTPEIVAKAAVGILDDPFSAAEYVVSGEGSRALG